MKRFVSIVLLILVAIPLFAANPSYDQAVAQFADMFGSAIGKDKIVAFVELDCDSESFADRFISDIEKTLINMDC